MRKIAINACHAIAEMIFDGEIGAWKRADRIERRFNVMDATQRRLEYLQGQRDQFLRDESAKHDQKHPDRLTYLHR